MKKYLRLLTVFAFAFFFIGFTSCLEPMVNHKYIYLDGSNGSTDAKQYSEIYELECYGGYDNFIDIPYIPKGSGYTTIYAELKWESPDGIQAAIQLISDDNMEIKQASETINFGKDFFVVSGNCLSGATYTDWSTGSAKTANCADTATRLQFFIQDSAYAPTKGFIYIKSIWLSGPGKKDKVLFGANQSYYQSERLSIKTVLDTESLSNGDVLIRVYTSRTNISRIGYVYSEYYKDFYDAYSIFNNYSFNYIDGNEDGEFKINATANGYYYIAAQDTNGNTAYKYVYISNIDKTPPSSVSNLSSEYNEEERTITVTWTNPYDYDFDYAEISCTKNGVTVVNRGRVSNGRYELHNIEKDNSEYIFSVCAVDVVGNKSSYSTTSIILRKTSYGKYSVGDVLLNDGTVIPYDADYLRFTDEEKQMAVGIIYGINEYGLPMGWLGIHNSYEGMNSGCYKWAAEGTTGTNTVFIDISCIPTDAHVEGGANTSTFTGDTDGSDNWNYICSVDPVGTADAATNYPAFYYVNNYASTFNLTGEYADGWYMPSLAELCFICRNKDILNSVLSALNATRISDGSYWSSSQFADYYYGDPTQDTFFYAGCAWLVRINQLFNDGSTLQDFIDHNGAISNLYVCCVRSFLCEW